MIVTLSPSDALLSAIAGSMRNIENMRDQRRHKHGFNPADAAADYQVNVIGAQAELAVCRALHVEWHGKGLMRGDDAGTFQVRATERDGKISLILHDDDDATKLFYPVRRLPGTLSFEVFRPWLCADGKKPEYWRKDVRSPAYFCPVEAL